MIELGKKFPKDFIWGTATSAYQIEGAAAVDGRGPSIWDTFCQQHGRVFNGDTGDVACDHYHRYQEDVALMADMGVKAYRFSISWSRLLPNGKTDSLNQSGVDFYNNLIDECLKHGITPWVTLYHWDLPDAIEVETDGWLDRRTADLFADYANLCFELFGDRVKNWITLNEPWVVAVLGYGQGVFAPGRQSNSEPYQAAHNLLLAHALAVNVYRNKFLETQKGQIGITNNCDWREPKTHSREDKKAAQIALEFFLGWFADPIYLGDYPQCMRERVGNRLPKFTDEEKALLKHSSDFFGLNHYTTMYAAKQHGSSENLSVFGNGGLSEDQGVQLSVDPEWALTDMQWAVVPWGCSKLLKWIAERYGNPPIYITENGCAYDDTIKEGRVDDEERQNFMALYIEECSNAMSCGVDLRGYFAWSLMDNFEWAMGYSKRFGLHYVDFSTGQRVAKESAKWYSRLIASSNVNTKLGMTA
ncbi:MAG: GH1 family beta-glucosidase [Gammaproteobacteria bacterium]|nr:GH1 family beta-glucosidase [Gammaproteobacteria bacterium]